MSNVVNKHNIIKLFTYIFTIIFVISIFFVVKSYAKDKDLNIDKVEIVEKSDGVTGEITSSSDGIVKDNITFHKLNDYVVYKIKIDNDLDKDIVINTITDNNDNPYITYEYDKHENETIKSGKSTNLLVKVIYKNDMSDLTKRNQTSDVRFTIDFSEGETTIGINPKTNDGIGINFIVLIVSFIGLVTCLIIKAKVFSKKTKILTMLMVGFISLPLITKAITLTLNLSINTNYNFYDKVILTYNIDGEEKTKVVPYGTKVEDVDFNYPEGYSVVNWKDEDNNSVSLNDKLKEDIKIKGNLVYSATPEVITTDYNKISYSAVNAKAFYISESSTFPTLSSIESTFALDTWTTATSSSTLTLGEGKKFYVYVLDNNDNISINRYEIPVWLLKHDIGRGIKANHMVGNMANSYIISMFSGMDYPISGGYTKEFYVLDKTKTTLELNLETKGFENLRVTINGETVESVKDYVVEKNTTIVASADPKSYTLSFDPNGGTFEGTTGQTVKVMTYDSSDNSTVGVATREGYVFDGWYTDPEVGEQVYNPTGSYSSNLNYWARIKNESAKQWVYDGNLTVYAHWSKKVNIAVEDYNTFTFELDDAVQYYVSKNKMVPSDGEPQSTFELNKWTTATNTGDLTLSAYTTYYIWYKKSNGFISTVPSEISVWYVSKGQGSYSFTLDKYSVEVRENDENGTLLSKPNGGAVYVLDGTKVYLKITPDSGYSLISNTTKVYVLSCTFELGQYYCNPYEIHDIDSITTWTVRSNIGVSASTTTSPIIIDDPIIIVPIEP